MRILPLVVLLACDASASSRARTEAACEAPADAEAPACLGVGTPAPVAPSEDRRSVTGAALTTCSTTPMTGWFRDGTCRTGPNDRGVHVVCAELTDAFLDYTKDRGNDLSTPRPGVGFPGLNAGDRWCLCASRWDEARQAGVAPPVVLEATHHKALETAPLRVWEDSAAR